MYEFYFTTTSMDATLMLYTQIDATYVHNVHFISLQCVCCLTGSGTSLHAASCTQ